MRTWFVGALFCLGPAGCGFEDTYDPNPYVHTGDSARTLILQRTRDALRPPKPDGGFPASAKNFWIFEGGSFGGSILYATFDCGSREDCLRAVEFLGGLRPEDLRPWEPSRYAVVTGGVGFYAKRAVPAWKALRADPWEVRGIRRGLVYERVTDGHRSMEYFAIDLARDRVYYHHERGGFPPDEGRAGRIGGGQGGQAGF